jgi:hypothetical protein
MPFIATDIEAHPAPLQVMASGKDRGKSLWGGAPAMMGVVIPHSEKAEMKPPYMCPGCSNHMYNNNMINMCHVR